MYRLPGDHRRPDLPSVHATGLSAEGKGHPETRWLPVALPGTPTASCPSGRALLVGTLASRPGRPITEQRAARDTTSSQHPVDSRLRCSGRREVCAVGNESPHSEMARRLGRACLPGANPGSPLPGSRQTSQYQRARAPMPSSRVGASPRPAGGARRQRAPASLAPAGGLAQGPSHAPRPGPRPAVPQPAAQQEPGSPGQWAPRPLGPRARPPAQWRGRRSPRAGQGRPS